MKKIGSVMLLCLGCFLSTFCQSQQTFNTCSAAFLDNKMVVDQYTTQGKCSLSPKATGKLTVNTVDLSPNQSKAIASIPFTVAIRDKDTKTLTLFSTQAFRQVPIQKILTRCRKGDSIVLLTVNKQYALPHNEILIH